MMKENGLYYDEIKKLLSVKAKKEYIVYKIKENGLEYEEIKKLLSIQEILNMLFMEELNKKRL